MLKQIGISTMPIVSKLENKKANLDPHQTTFRSHCGTQMKQDVLDVIKRRERTCRGESVENGSVTSGKGSIVKDTV